MAEPKNRAAWLLKAGEDLVVDTAPMPTPGPGELVVRNRAVAINPLDCHMQNSGVFVQQWPTILGCDVAGEVYDTGPDVERFKRGDRVIGHAINLTTGRPKDGAFTLYTVVLASKAAILPAPVSFTDGVVLPFAIEAATCALCVKNPGIAMPGVPTPAMGLPYPSCNAREHQTREKKQVLVVYGGSSSVGSATTQLATAAGVHVIAIAGSHNRSLVLDRCGAAGFVDRADGPDLVDSVVSAVRVAVADGASFVGIFDAISTPETYAHDLAILDRLGGETHLACVHPPPTEGVPEGVKAGMIFGVNDIASSVWVEYVTPALESGGLKCLPPPTVVGKGLESVSEALRRCRGGVSGTKLVVEL